MNKSNDNVPEWMENADEDKLDEIVKLMKPLPCEIDIYKPLHLEYLNKPMKFWEEKYIEEHYKPILVLGDRTDTKYEVALQICKYFDENFTVNENVFYDVEKLYKSLDKGMSYLVPSLTSSMPYIHTRTGFERAYNYLQVILDVTRIRQNILCFGSSGTLRNLDKHLLDHISHVILVQKTLPKYHIVEHLQFQAPVTPNNITRPPTFDDIDKLVEFKEKLQEHISVYITKYPRCDESDMRKFENHRKAHLNDLMEDLEDD